MFPIFVDVADRLALVVGGGPVGQRKAAALRAAGARVRLVCLELRPADTDYDWLTAAYSPSHFEGVSLAFTAATPTVDATVLADARSRGVWACVAGDPSVGDFTVPATLRRGPFVVAVSTGGASPSLARRVRDRLAGEYDDTFGEWVALLAEFREWVLTHVEDGERRRALLEAASEWEWLERLRRDGVEATRAVLWASVGELLV